MSLIYRLALDIPAKQVSSLDFSPSGTKLVAGTDDGNVIVWDTVTGNQYYPTLTSPRIEGSDISGSSVVLWLDESTFLCGFFDGYMTTCRLEPLPSVHENSIPQYRLRLLRRQMNNSEIKLLAYRKEISCVAISGSQKLRLWTRKGALDWEYWKALRGPTILEERRNFPLEITSCAWSSDVEKDHLIVSYLHNGIIVWDIKEAAPLQCINAGGTIYGGAWCAEVQKFVAINRLRKLDIYDTLHSGQIWSPEFPRNLFAIKAIHRGSGVVAGGCGQSELVDVAERLITQTLRHDVSLNPTASGAECEMKAIAAHQDQAEENFMIATASRDICSIWRTEIQCEESSMNKKVDEDK